MRILILVILLGLSIVEPAQDFEICKRTIKDVVLQTRNTLHLIPQGEKKTVDSIEIILPEKWNISRFLAPPFTSQRNITNWDQFFPSAQLLQSNIRREDNILIMFEKKVECYLHFYEDNWTSFNAFYRINHGNLRVEKCQSLVPQTCTLLTCEKEKLSGNLTHLPINSFHVSWKLNSNSVTFLVSTENNSFKCLDSYNILKFQSLVMRGNSAVRFSTTSYNSFTTVHSGSYNFEPSFNLNSGQSLQLWISMCKQCDTSVILKDKKGQVRNRRQYPGLHLSNTIFSDNGNISIWQEVVLNVDNKKCSGCFLAIETDSTSYNDSYWSIVPEIRTVTVRPSQIVCDHENYVLGKTKNYLELDVFLVKAIGPNYRKTTSYCVQNEEEPMSCICPQRRSCQITIEVKKEYNPVIIKWCDSNTSEPSPKYTIEMENKNSATFEKITKTVRNPWDVVEALRINCWETAFLDLQSETIYEVRISSDVCFSSAYFQTQ